MKKLLNVLGAFGLIASSGSAVMAMSPNNKGNEANDIKNLPMDLSELDGKDFDYGQIEYGRITGDYFFDINIPKAFDDYFGLHPLDNFLNHTEIFNVTENRPYDAAKDIYIPEHGAGTYVFRTTYTPNAEGVHLGFVNSATITATFHYAAGDLSEFDTITRDADAPVVSLEEAKTQVNIILGSHLATGSPHEDTALFYIINQGGIDKYLVITKWQYFDKDNNEITAADVNNLTSGESFIVRPTFAPNDLANSLGISGTWSPNVQFIKA